MKKLLRRKCPVCNTWFKPISDNHWICSYVCSIADKTEKQKAKIEKIKNTIWKKEKAEMKKGLQTKGEWLTLLQSIFNTYIRLRDKDLPCISCGCKTANKWDAGHFYPTTYSFLRLDEDNVHKQCSKNCNMEKHGNMAEYRPRLIERIGLQRVLRLDNSRHLKLELSIPEIKELIHHYKLKIKQLKNETHE